MCTFTFLSSFTSEAYLQQSDNGSLWSIWDRIPTEGDPHTGTYHFTFETQFCFLTRKETYKPHNGDNFACSDKGGFLGVVTTTMPKIQVLFPNPITRVVHVDFSN